MSNFNLLHHFFFAKKRTVKDKNLMFSSATISLAIIQFKQAHSDYAKNGILLPKLFWPTVRKNGSSDREILLKFVAEGQEFAKCLRSLEQFIQTVKGQN